MLIFLEDISVERTAFPSSATDALIESEMMDIYRMAVNRLPERCKCVFLLVREQNRSHKEVSEILGITPGTVEVQMNIAIRKIINVVEVYYPRLVIRATARCNLPLKSLTLPRDLKT